MAVKNPFHDPEQPLLERNASQPVADVANNTGNFALIFIMALTTLLPLSSVCALVSTITEEFSSQTFELTIGTLYITALPVAWLQLSYDRHFDSVVGSKRAFQLRSCLGCGTLAIGCAVMSGRKSQSRLLGCAFCIGVASWVSNSVTISIAGILPSEVFVWQGAGFQLATLFAFTVTLLAHGMLSWQTLWILIGLCPLVGLVCAQLLLEDPVISARLAEKDRAAARLGKLERSVSSVTASLVPPEVKMIALCLSVNMAGSVVVAGLMAYFKGTAFGTFQLPELLFLCFSSANVLSRPLVAVLRAYKRRPPLSAIVSLTCTRSLAVAACFGAAFAPLTGQTDETVAAATLFTCFALLGGSLVTWCFTMARDAAGDDADAAVQTSRVMNLHQNAGLTLAGAFNCSLALLRAHLK